MKTPNFLFLAAASALTGVGFGAFGAHTLKTIVSPEILTVYQTGVSYQMWHALGLFGIALLQQQTPEKKHLSWAGCFMFSGILLFSGSLYLLAITGQKWLGIITPFGGVCFLVAWLLLCLAVYKKNTP